MFYFGRAIRKGPKAAFIRIRFTIRSRDIKADKTYRIIYLENEYVRIGVSAGNRRAAVRGRGQEQRLRFHLSPARHQAGARSGSSARGCPAASSGTSRIITAPPRSCRCNIAVEENADGSKTVWVGELELRQRMRWAVGYTLPPGKSYLHCQGAHHQPHAGGQHDALLRQRGGARERSVSGHFSAEHAVRHLSRQARVHHLADRDHAVQRRRFQPRHGRELVQEPRQCQLDVRLELRRRFLRRLRSRQGSRHDERGGSSCRSRQEILDLGQRVRAGRCGTRS